MGKVAVAGSIMVIFIKYFVNFHILIPLSILIYFTIVYLSGGIDEIDVKILKQLFGHKTEL